MATAAEQATPQEIDLRNSLNAEKRKSSLGAMSDFADTARMIAAQRKQSQLQHGTADATAGSTLQQTAADRGNAEQNLGNATKQHQPGQPQGNFSSASLARREQPEEPEPDMEDEETSEAYNEMLAEVGESQQKQSKADKLNAVKSAASQDRASYSPMTFVVMLGLAVTKDSLDVGTAELFSWADWILDWILAFILFFLMMGRGGTRFKLKMARVALVFFFSSAIESIPLFGFLASWTLAVLWAWSKARKFSGTATKVEEHIDTLLEGLAGKGQSLKKSGKA